MNQMIVCEIRPGALPALKALRLRHLEYIAQKRSVILFGGPARAADGTPETMIIVVKTEDRTAAEAFIAHEPYNASGEVFGSVTIRSWSQVIPETAANSIESAIDAERASRAAPA